METKTNSMNKSQATTAPAISKTTAVNAYDELVANYPAGGICFHYLVKRHLIASGINNHVTALTAVTGIENPRSYDGTTTWLGLDQLRGLVLRAGQNIAGHITHTNQFQRWIRAERVFWVPILGTPDRRGKFIIIDEKEEVDDGDDDGGMAPNIAPPRPPRRRDPEAGMQM